MTETPQGQRRSFRELVEELNVPAGQVQLAIRGLGGRIERIRPTTRSRC
jgi:hypothetical protein